MLKTLREQESLFLSKGLTIYETKDKVTWFYIS